MDIDIQSPVFNSMLSDLNKEIQRVIYEVYEEEFESGEITLKLDLQIPEAFIALPKADENGEIINETYKFRKPLFEHKVTTTFKKQYKKEGVFTGDREVRYEDGKFIAVPVKDAQMSMT